MGRTLRELWAGIACATALAAALTAQGIETRSGAIVLYGNTARCTQPAKISYKKVRAKTEQWKTIRKEGIPAGSARYSLLISKMSKQIKAACRAVAEELGKDCVVRKDDVADSKGLEVVDITAEVGKKLESKDLPS